ncbi:unnamed protein product [Oikopleura dioica]|uniref:Uncharacterized protein n=1 Tax=Oikopleura dioica TaxID=34765 RepID=E4X7C2_OIKDI|nr:unnamed protein product [Oikopleura dioica]
MAKAKEKALEEKGKENARSHEYEEIRKANARGIEKRRADGGVSFLYDQPQIVERYQEERDKRLKEIEKGYMFEWQKNAPRDRFVDSILPTEIASKPQLHMPFNGPNVMLSIPCFRCKQHGHLTYDKVCPRYSDDISEAELKGMGKNFQLVEIDPRRIESLVEDFTNDYVKYHGAPESGIAKEKFAYRQAQMALNPEIAKTLREHSGIDTMIPFMEREKRKKEDLEYVDGLGVIGRRVLLTTVRRMMRDKKRKLRIKLLEKELYDFADKIYVSDDSDSEGEYEIDVPGVQEEFANVIDELVFGPDEPVVKIEPIDDTMIKSEPLEEEKKKSIGARLRQRLEKQRRQVEKLEHEIKGITETPDKTDETKALYEMKLRKEKGFEAISKIKGIEERLRKLDEQIVAESEMRKSQQLHELSAVATRTDAETLLRKRIEERKHEADRECRRREREEKRKLRKMNKKLERLKAEQEESETLRQIGFAGSVEEASLNFKPKRKTSESDADVIVSSICTIPKEISVMTKEQKLKLQKEEEEKAKEAGKVYVPRRELKTFEKEINGKKHKIDESFLSQFGIKLD